MTIKLASRYLVRAAMWGLLALVCLIPARRFLVSYYNHVQGGIHEFFEGK